MHAGMHKPTVLHLFNILAMLKIQCNSFPRWERRRYASSCPFEISPSASIPSFHKPETLKQIWGQWLISSSSLGTERLERRQFGEESCLFILFFFLKQVCRLHGLVLARLNLATSNCYNVDLDPCCCRGHRQKGAGGAWLLGVSDGSWRAWDCVSCRRCIKVLLERENARKKGHKIPPGSARNGICKGQKSRACP